MRSFTPPAANDLYPLIWKLFDEDSDRPRLVLSGDWTVSAIGQGDGADLIRCLQQIQSPGVLSIQDGGIRHWDTLLLATLLEISQAALRQKLELDVSAMPEGVRSLFALATAVPSSPDAHHDPVPRGYLADLGEAARRFWADALYFNQFLGEAAISMAAFLHGRARYRRVDLWLQIQECGPAAVPIVTMISLLVGLILAFVGAVQLSLFGAELYIADLVALGMTREMGALMTAIIMSGRSGAAFAAQIGTMNVNMEVSALKVMGFSPVDFLVLPRLIALILVMPFLGLYSDLLGIAGGALVGVAFFDIPPSQFLLRTSEAVDLTDFFIGLVKCSLFGVLIALAGCMRGVQCGRTASAVGDAATSAVVTSIVLIVVADSIVTLICNRLNI
jgi:phospholipid/cholesterol/gamma-HCH transport system permease protein